MWTLDLKVGTSCNNSCRHCAVAASRGVLPDRSLSEITRIMEWGRSRCDRLVLTGGELTVRKDCFDIVRRARDLGYAISIQTNARMFSYKNFTAEFLDASGKEVSFLAALLSADEKIHNYLTSKDSFHQTVAGIQNLVEAGVYRVDMNTVVTRLNLAGLAAHARLAAALGVQAVQYAFVHPFGNAEKNIEEMMPGITEAALQIKGAIDILRGSGINARSEALPFCLLRGYEDYASEPEIPNTIVADLDVTILNFNELRMEWEKSKGPQCGSCLRGAECEGPWRRYPERFGWSEFIPFNK